MSFRFRIFLVIATGLLVTSIALGQTAAAPAFDVASVRRSSLDMVKLATQIRTTGQMPRIGAHIDGARAEYIFMGLKELIADAYKVRPFQITGPDWLNGLGAPRFDIQATLPEGTTKDQVHNMLQALLAERFKLTLHTETKEHPVLALVVGKGGLKLPESAPDPAQDFDENTPLKPGENQIDTADGPVRMTVDVKGGSSVVNMGQRGLWTQKMGANGALRIEGKKTTMSAFADMLTQMTQISGGAGVRVVDMTDLKGHYDVALDVPIADLLKMVQAAGFGGGEDAAGRTSSPVPEASDPGGSTTIFDAVKALGLKLEKRKAPTEQLVIDHLEKVPTEN